MRRWLIYWDDKTAQMEGNMAIEMVAEKIDLSVLKEYMIKRIAVEQVKNPVIKFMTEMK
jgi:hypothetical protein